MADDEEAGRLAWGSAEVLEEEARAELERLLADTDFHCSERNRKFLQFIAEQSLSGRSQSVKAYTIAVDVFGRPPSFDASTDPIVRIEATRLRSALARYYDHRPLGSIGIELPKGRYIPIFYREKRNPDFEPLDDEVPVDSKPSEPVSVIASRLSPPPRTRWLAILLGVAAGALLVALLLQFRSSRIEEPPRVSQRPAVSVEFTSADDAASESSGVHDALLVALSRFQSLRVLSSEYTQNIPAESKRPEYRIVLKYRIGVRERSFWWQVVDIAEGEAVESGETKQTVSSPPTSAELDELLRRLSLRLAGGNGVINSRLLAKEIERPTLGNGCILRAYRALQTAEPESSADAKVCLQQTIALQPSYVDAKGLLALFAVRENNYDELTPALENARAMARDAYAVAPDSSNVIYARMTLEFLFGRPDIAIAVARHALDINPYHGAVTARLSEILYLTGERTEALTLARRASTVDGVIYRDAELTLAMEAYRHERYAESLHHIDRTGREMSYGPAMVKLAALAYVGSAEDVETFRSVLLAKWPRFATTFRPMMSRFKADADLVGALEVGFRKAGLNLK